ncbi:MAG: sulfatase-like hydrolase/transferase [Acidobacteria bacterium]|nr:sulfatase-like hydrolase/transferase [Acidobacteriota bacterium]MDA1233492.1 sulfatase-like hydrolase/transferase [Acidobacteriota bacterium]
MIAGASCGSGGQNNEEQAQSKPNVIFVLVDDMGWGDVGAFWQNQRKANNDRSEPWQLTPSLDELAAGGVMLTSHYTAAPVCAPSRASLLLGVSQGHANVRDNQFDKELQDNYTLGTVLRGAGYHTATIGKWGLQGGDSATPGPDWPAHPANRGFDYYLGYMRHRDGHEHYPKEGIYRGSKEVWENKTNIADDLDKAYTADLWTAAAKRYITEKAQATEQSPFFLYLAYDTPHAVLELPTQAYPEGGGLNGGLRWTGRPGQMINTASGTVDSYVYPEYKTATYDHDNNPATPEVNWPETYQRYASACRRIDDGVGDLVTLLKDLGIYENTLIVFTSDNGPSEEDYLPEGRSVKNTPDFFNSFGPFDGIKRDLWEGGVREPTIVSWPGRIAGNRVIDEPSAMYDWMATFAEAVGIPAPARTDGVSLLPLLTGDRDSVEHPVYVEYFESRRTPSYTEFLGSHAGRQRSQMQMIRMGDFSGVRYDIQSADDDFEIYNVVQDPQEADNLTSNSAYQEMQDQMKRKVLQIRRPDPGAPRPYDSALIPAIEAQPLETGLRWSAYEGSFPWVSDVAGLTPSSQGSADLPDASVMKQAGMLLYEGVIRVPEDGEYEFSAQGDGPFIVRLHEALLADASYGYQPGQQVSATAMLQAGSHPVRIYLLKKTAREQDFEIQWHAPGASMAKMSAADFFHE